MEWANEAKGDDTADANEVKSPGLVEVILSQDSFNYV